MGSVTEAGRIAPDGRGAAPDSGRSNPGIGEGRFVARHGRPRAGAVSMHVRIGILTMLLTGAGVGLRPTNSLAQNLVQDPGFESATGCGGGFGNCTGAASWTYTG